LPLISPADFILRFHYTRFPPEKKQLLQLFAAFASPAAGKTPASRLLAITA
jgi:hypothetical protein